MIPARPGERGAIAVLFALLLPIFVGVAAFVIDFGYLDVQRAALQNAADAAALSLAVDCDLAYADRLAEGNAPGVVRAETTCEKGQASVRYELEVPAFFGPIYGFDSYTVSAAASAVAKDGHARLTA